MQISEKALELIKQCEGFRSHAYRDLTGHPTIGYGHKLTPREAFPVGITQSAALALLERDVQTAEAEVASLVKVQLTQGQVDALVDFTFNLGSGRLAGSTLLRLLNAGEHDAAGNQLLRWDRADGKPNADLHARRQAELALWKSA
jgi:lysozyme